MDASHVAEGAEARMRQVAHALGGHRPAGVAGLAWDATRAVRGAVPALQDALAGRDALAAPLDRDAVGRGLSEGCRIPAARPGRACCTPREGARLVGFAEGATGIGWTGLMALWAEPRARKAGARGGEFGLAVGAMLTDVEAQRRFGECLADAVLGIPGAPMAALPRQVDLGFAFTPGGVPDTRARVDAACEGRGPTTRRDAALDAAREVGHVQGLKAAATVTADDDAGLQLPGIAA